MSNSLQSHGLQHARLPCLSPTPGASSNSCPSSWWCHPTISSSVDRFFSCLQSFPALGSFPMSQFFSSGGQSIGASASASVLPMHTQDWFPLGRTVLISLQSKGLSRVFADTTVPKHQFLLSLSLSLLPAALSYHPKVKYFVINIDMSFLPTPYIGRPGFHPWVGKIPWRRERLPTPVFWPGEFYGWHSPWGHKESDTTNRLSLSLHQSISKCWWL